MKLCNCFQRMDSMRRRIDIYIYIGIFCTKKVEWFLRIIMGGICGMQSNSVGSLGLCRTFSIGNHESRGFLGFYVGQGSHPIKLFTFAFIQFLPKGGKKSSFIKIQKTTKFHFCVKLDHDVYCEKKVQVYKNAYYIRRVISSVAAAIHTVGILLAI